MRVRLALLPALVRVVRGLIIALLGRAGLRSFAVGFGVFLAFGSYSREAGAYAWMIKHGFSKCGTCHTDPSGGETLNHFGRVASQSLLSSGDDEVELSTTSQFLFGAIAEPGRLRLGGSYRHMVLYTGADGDTPGDFTHFPMQADIYGSARFGDFVIGGSLGVARGIEGTAYVRAAQLNKETGDGWIILSRNHFLGLWLEENTLLRIGRLNLPFGVRVPEHTLWVREATRTDRESDQQHGAALTYSGGNLRADAMIIIGNFQVNPDRFRERGFAATLEYLIEPTLAVGASGLLTRVTDERLTRERNAIRYAYGVNARWGVSPELSILAEADMLKEQGRTLGYTGFVQPDYEPLRGVHLFLTGELLKSGQLQRQGIADAESGETHLGLWASAAWFFTTHFDLRFDVVARQQAPLAIQTQLHFYF